MRLMLLRHAKSDWGDPSLDDIDRPLNPRGKAAAASMGRYIKEKRLFPDVILCSTSQRTRETLSRLLPHLPQKTTIQLLPDLYTSSEGDYLSLIKSHGGSAAALMVIGHNPATEQTALDLSATGADDAMADMREKYPTAALAIVDFKGSDWAELQADTGHLERFVKSRDLA
ncbi:histidine phosphatase family protein [Roseibium denhamense]|uniref:Phosphohistidine phosphatase n=1 Tax=Roseibium denhamense TaxID=76305 RepID=A0ABY1N8E4_9HYPH|nr:histidine phosphatase family protein [Roseibium denhamense]MTI05608.1 histidine phosphatase family protein [Roseibium denhamense]SMP03167.1 phosphohistidine phosphatase [Roseibium denhamense]